MLYVLLSLPRKAGNSKPSCSFSAGASLLEGKHSISGGDIVAPIQAGKLQSASLLLEHFKFNFDLKKLGHLNGSRQWLK